jgi:antitoxin YefM
MDAVSYSQFRQNLKTVIDQACDQHEPVIITRRQGGNAVILSHEDYRSMMETCYLLKSPKMAQRLLASLESFRCKQGVARAIDLGTEDNE